MPPFNEADTRAKLIDPALHARQWIEIVKEEYRATHGAIHREQSAVRIDILDGKPLKSACGDGLVRIAISAACLEELGRVLAYPEFELDAASRDALFTQVRNCTYRVETILLSPLPRCADPDDQKFLELARDAQADWLITKDKALLGLAKKRVDGAGFRIGTPEHWTAALESVIPR